MKTEEKETLMALNLLDASVYFLFLYVCLIKITNKDMSRISQIAKGFEFCTSLPNHRSKLNRDNLTWTWYIVGAPEKLIDRVSEFASDELIAGCHIKALLLST